MNPHAKHWLWTLLRIALCVAAVGYVVSRTDFHDTVFLKSQDVPVRLIRLSDRSAEIMRDGQSGTVALEQLQTGKDSQVRVSWGLASLASRSNKGLLMLAILLYGIQPLLQIVRFRWMLRLQSIAVEWSAAASMCFVGNFYSYVIPGMTGGDIVRASYLLRNSSNRHGGLVAIALDRLTGMAGMFALAGIAGLLLPVQEPAVRYAARVSLLIFVGMVAGFAMVTGWRWVTVLLGRLPLGNHLQGLYEAVSAGRRGWPILLASVALTVILQAGAMASFSVAAVALGLQPAWQQYFVCLPVALVIAAIPIVPMGAGTLEAAMIFLLAEHVGSVSQVVGLAFAMRIIGLVWALPGGVVPLLRPSTAARSERTEDASLSGTSNEQ